MLTVNQLEVKYGSHTALSIVEPIRIGKGERIGIIGSNGAGKTTLIKSILGLVSYAGSIDTEWKPEEMAVHMQQNHYVSTMSVQSVMEGILGRRIKNSLEIQELIRFFDFEICLRKKYKVLSGGQKQKMTIILILTQNAPLVFFDEVTSGLDFESRQNLMDLLLRWYRDKETTLCMISHYYEELEHMAEKILMLDKGRVVDFGRKEELFYKYCGRTIIVLEHTDQNRRLTEAFPKLEAPPHLIAVSCREEGAEERLTTLLGRENINYKRSNCDIEIMFINAKKKFESERSETGVPKNGISKMDRLQAGRRQMV